MPLRRRRSSSVPARWRIRHFLHKNIDGHIELVVNLSNHWQCQAPSPIQNLGGSGAGTEDPPKVRTRQAKLLKAKLDRLDWGRRADRIGLALIMLNEDRQDLEASKVALGGATPKLVDEGQGTLVVGFGPKGKHITHCW